MGIRERMTNMREAFGQEGMAGVNYEIAEARLTKSLDASLWGFMEKFVGVPQFLEDVEQMVGRIETEGLHNISREMLDKLGIQVHSRLVDKDGEVVSGIPNWMEHEGESVLFFGNHEQGLEPQVLASACQRDDITFVGNEFVRQIGPGIQKYVLPILSTRYAKDNDKELSRREAFMVGEKRLTTEEIRAMNNNSLHEAAERISEGHAVGIFPTPGVPVSGKWGSGLGRIIHELTENGIDLGKVRLVPIRFDEVPIRRAISSVRDRYVKNQDPKPIDVNMDFGEGMNLRDANFAGSTPQEIAAGLREWYLEQFGLKKE